MSRIWLPVAVAVTVLSAVIHVAVQQSYRTAADDPQWQLAEDGAAALEAGASPASLVEMRNVRADQSLSPFVVVVGPTNMVLASNVQLDGATPKPPAGVLAKTRSAGVDRVTWAPKPDVRIALVSRAAKDGRVVIAGRNLREVERREEQLGKIIMLGWGIAEFATLAMALGVELVAGRMERLATPRG